VRFGPFVLDRQRAELMRGGVAVPVRPTAFSLLSLFAARPGRVLSKEELLDAAWPGVVVTEDSLTQCVHELRTALGDAGPVMLRTVPRRGYRLDAEVMPDAAADLSAASVPPDSAAPRAPGWRERLLGWFGAALTLALMAGLAVFAVLRPPAQPPMGVSARPPLSIIVLPLVNARGESVWFSDALSNDLTFELGQVPGAFVISRDTAFTYKGKVVDPRAVARELGVRYVVQGSVQRESDRVRLRLSMVDGETGALQWSQEFDSDRAGLPASLADTAQQVARSLSVQMYRSTGARAAALSPDQVQADDSPCKAGPCGFAASHPRTCAKPDACSTRP
jgi:DNA-binding winged helix-turn-helix (wHTH) protein/TolB-like protein